MGFIEYVASGYDPCVNVVLLEDLAAVLGVAIAAGSMGLSLHFQSHVPDAVGSILIGGLLGSVASFMIYTNSAALIGRSIPEEKIRSINAALEGDIMVRAVHDVKGEADSLELQKIFFSFFVCHFIDTQRPTY
jgi:solute carrier family 30 (zinc transporter), member 9